MSIQTPATNIQDPEPQVEVGFGIEDTDLTASKGLEALAAKPVNHDPTHEPSSHNKPCSLCGRRRDVLIRCQIVSKLET
jgi:hypothetical protein